MLLLTQTVQCQMSGRQTGDEMDRISKKDVVAWTRPSWKMHGETEKSHGNNIFKRHILERSCSRIIRTVTTLQAGRSRVWMPVGAKCFSLLWNIQTSSGFHPAFYTVGVGAIFWLVLRLRISGAVPELNLHAFAAWTEKTLPSHRVLKLTFSS
jgi:hypothetical protein